MIRAIVLRSSTKARARCRPGLPIIGLALAIVAVACGGGPDSTVASSSAGSVPSVTVQPEETPPPELQSPSSYIRAIEPTLDDRTGLATGVTTVAGQDPFAEGLTIDPSGGPNLLVSWFGSPCELEPTLHLEGAAARLNVTVYRGPVIPVECPAMQVHRVVRISLTSAVDPAAASLAVREGMPPE